MNFFKKLSTTFMIGLVMSTASYAIDRNEQLIKDCTKRFGLSNGINDPREKRVTKYFLDEIFFEKGTTNFTTRLDNYSKAYTDNVPTAEGPFISVSDSIQKLIIFKNKPDLKEANFNNLIDYMKKNGQKN